MRRATLVLPKGQWDEAGQKGTVTLSYSDRHRRRIRLFDDAGEGFLLDLADAIMLQDGDGLLLEGGGVIRVQAAEESVAEVHCADPDHLARVAWHLGNRHLPVQLLPGGRIRFIDDHVINAMVEGLGGHLTRARAPFQPEGGAYSGGGHGHAHG